MEFELNKKYLLVMFDKYGNPLFDSTFMSYTIENELKTLYEYVRFNSFDSLEIYDAELYNQAVDDDACDLISDSFVASAKVHHLGGKNYILEWR